MKKLLYVGTHINQTNGYSKVVYNHLRMMQNKPNLYVILYGIHGKESNDREINANNIFIHKASKSQNGFAFEEFKDFVKISTPDIIFIYNDPWVCTNYLRQIEFYNCRKIVYIDTVYKNMNTNLLGYIKSQCDTIYVFNEFIKNSIDFKDTRVLYHGIDFEKMNHVTKEVACTHLKLDPTFTYFLNLNRNTPRKRYDIFIKSVVLFISRNKLKVKFIIGTLIKDAFDLIEIFNNECKKYNLTCDFTDVFEIIENPQDLNDKIVNLLYCASDVGINTCDGEGWGLCNFEHMAYGKPQIVPRHDSFNVFCNEENSIQISPKWSYYVDTMRDANGGEADVVDPVDVAEAISTYANYNTLIKSHGNLAAEDIKRFSWTNVATEFISSLGV